VGMPTPERSRQVVETYVATVNGRDPDALVALFTEDAVQADPASNPPNIGRDAIRTFFTNAVEASEGWAFDLKALHTCGDHVAIDFVMTVSSGGTTVIIDGIEVFALDEDEKIRSVHAYWDEADMTFG
jgi:steroid delta-isomerase